MSITGTGASAEDISIGEYAKTRSLLDAIKSMSIVAKCDTSYPPFPDKVQCPYCTRWFKNLRQHQCDSLRCKERVERLAKWAMPPEGAEVDEVQDGKQK